MRIFLYISVLTVTSIMTVKAAASPPATPSSGLVEPDAFIWGMNGHPLGGGGVYTDDRGVTLEEQFSYLKALGTNWYRFDVFARDPEPGGWNSQDELDRIVPAAEEAGISLFPTLYPPMELRPYETLPDRMDNEAIYQMSYEHARKAAMKWRGRIRVWDLLNEPDGWMILPERHGLEKADYDTRMVGVATAILKGQADGIRAGDPETKISLNTGGWLHTGFVDHMIDAGVDFDILSWHWYGDMGSIERVDRVGDYRLLDKLLEYGKPIWIGEINARPTQEKPENQKIHWLINTASTLASYRDRGVEAVFFYELLNLGSAEGDAGYGLIELERMTSEDGVVHFAAGEPTATFDAVRQLVKQSSSTSSK